MPYEIFARQTVRQGNPPTITIAKAGRIGLNKPAALLLKDDTIDQVLLLWDAAAQKIAIRPMRKKDERAMRINFNKAGGAAIAGKGFCNYIGHDFGETKKYLAEW